MVPAVEFQHVSFAFDEHIILDDISFAIPEGSMRVLLGPSGWPTNKAAGCKDTQGHVEETVD